jgi:hypothetical protein
VITILDSCLGGNEEVAWLIWMLEDTGWRNPASMGGGVISVLLLGIVMGVLSRQKEIGYGINRNQLFILAPPG